MTTLLTLVLVFGSLFAGAGLMRMALYWGADGGSGTDWVPTPGSDTADPAPIEPEPETTQPEPTSPEPTPVPAPMPEPEPAPKPAPAPKPTPLEPAPAPKPQPIPPGPVLRRVSHDQPTVVLTFDDGPTPLTKALLDVLEKEQVPAAFFWLVGQAKPEIAQEAVARGHQVGTHTMKHVRMTTLSAEEQHKELALSSQRLTELAGQATKFFRPPYGAYQAETTDAAKALGLSVVMWDVDSRDWELGTHPEQIVPNVMGKVRAGSIILLHERKQTLEVLPDLIKALKEAGYSFALLPTPEPQQ